MFALSGILETFEFSPVFWTFDSHSLFHFFTIPVPILTYGFIIDDSRYLLRGEERRAKTAYHFELNFDDDDQINDRNFNSDDRRKAQ